MAKGKKGRRKGQTSNSFQLPKDSSPDSIACLLAELWKTGKSKVALDLAKKWHEQEGTADAERVLIEAYLQRYRGLMNHNMATEATALLTIAQERFGDRPEFDALRQADAIKSGKLDELLAPLNQENVSPQAVQHIDAQLRQLLGDPQALARCTVLPETHPLRLAAKGVAQALTAVCAGPVRSEEIALREVSRRSPLASWKRLIHALHLFYSHEDKACLEVLHSIPEQDAPAPLASVLLAALGETDRQQLSETQKQLVEHIEARKFLEPELAHLEHGFDTQPEKQTLSRVRRLTQLFEKWLPQYKEQFQQICLVRIVLDEHSPFFRQAIAASPMSTEALRLTACGFDALGDLHRAIVAWAFFHQRALQESQLLPGSTAESTLLAHIASLAEVISPRHITRDMPDLQPFVDYLSSMLYPNASSSRRQQGVPNLKHYFDPAALYEQATREKADSAVLAQWLTFVEQSDTASIKDIEVLAKRWAQNSSQDVRPLLRLVKFAEARNALAKALVYLNQAQKINGFHPEVQHAHLRLLSKSVMRHLSTRKPQLLANDLRAIGEICAAQKRQPPALVYGLLWLVASLDNDSEAAKQAATKLSAYLPGDQERLLFVLMLAENTKVRRSEILQLPAEQVPMLAKTLAGSLPKALLLVEECGLLLRIPKNVNCESLSLFYSSKKCIGEASEFLATGRAALRTGQAKLAFNIAGAGIRLHAANAAAFFLLRAQALPDYTPERKRLCLLAAISLAKTQRQVEVLDQAVAELHTQQLSREKNEDLSAEQLQKLRTQESKGAYPKTREVRPFEDPCMCPECRRRRRLGFDDQPDKGFSKFFEELEQKGAPGFADFFSSEFADYLPDSELGFDPKLGPGFRSPGSRSKSKRKTKKKKR